MYNFDIAIERIDKLTDKGQFTHQLAIGIVRNTNKQDQDAVRDYITTRIGKFPECEHTKLTERILGRKV